MSSLFADNGNVSPCGVILTDFCFNVPQTSDKQHNVQELNVPVSMHLSDDIVPHTLYTSSPAQQSLVSATPVATSSTTHLNFINYRYRTQLSSAHLSGAMHCFHNTYSASTNKLQFRHEGTNKLRGLLNKHHLNPHVATSRPASGNCSLAD